MKLMKTVRFLSVIKMIILGLVLPLSAQTPSRPVKPAPTERIGLWTGKAPVGDDKFVDCSDSRRTVMVSTAARGRSRYNGKPPQ